MPGWGRIPFLAPLLFWSCFIKKFFGFFFYVVVLVCAFFFFSLGRLWKHSDRDECEWDIWRKHSLRRHNTHAGNSEHIYHFSWCFVQFSSMQLWASVPKDVAWRAATYRGDHRTRVCIWEVTVVSLARRSPPGWRFGLVLPKLATVSLRK